LYQKPHYGLKLTERQKQFIYGGLLGDLCAVKPKGKNRNAYLSVNHSSKQAEYVQFKYSILKPFVRVPPRIIQNFGWGKELIAFHTLCHPEFTEIYNICYQGGRKTISWDWLLKIHSSFALAIWYMDDGSLNKSAATINTHSFSEDEQLILQEWLQKRWKIYTIIKQDNRRKRFFLFFHAKERDKFFDLIRPYVIPSMRYKILPEIKPVPCVICGKPVIPKRAVLSAGKKVVCSNPECKKMLAKLNKGWKPKKPRACVVCGRIFTPIQDKTKTCSSACRRTYRLQQKRLRRLRNKKPLPPRNCLVCGRTFVPTHGNQRICSEECRRKRKKEYQRRYEERKRPSII